MKLIYCRCRMWTHINLTFHIWVLAHHKCLNWLYVLPKPGYISVWGSLYLRKKTNKAILKFIHPVNTSWAHTMCWPLFWELGIQSDQNRQKSCCQGNHMGEKPEWCSHNMQMERNTQVCGKHMPMKLQKLQKTEKGGPGLLNRNFK